MEGGSEEVLEEVESLFQKLEAMPDEVKQKAFHKILKILPPSSSKNVDNSGSQLPKYPKEKQKPERQQKHENESVIQTCETKILDRPMRPVRIRKRAWHKYMSDSEDESTASSTKKKSKRDISIQGTSQPRDNKATPSTARKKKVTKCVFSSETTGDDVSEISVSNASAIPDDPPAELQSVIVKLENIVDESNDEGYVAKTVTSSKRVKAKCVSNTEETEIQGEDDAEDIKTAHGNRKHHGVDEDTEDTIITAHEKFQLLDEEFSSTENSAADSQKYSMATLSCDHCSFKTIRKAALKNHLRRHAGADPYTCKECGKKFQQQSGLRIHMKRHRGQRDFACDYCEYRAYTKVDIMRHMTMHTGEKNHVCQYCGKLFAKDSTLREHLKCVHEKSRQFVCSQCGFVTYRANNLRVHINMRHRGEHNNHVCPVCGAKVKQKTSFLDHMRSHTGERPYSCRECDSSFACVARLTAHVKSVHGTRDFTCRVCSKPFQTKHHLFRHMVIHTKEKPFKCPFCQYACNAQGNLTKHVKTVHRQRDFSYRQYKEQLLRDPDAKPVKSEWIEKGQQVTEQYLEKLSSKLGRNVTLSELQKQEAEKRVRTEIEQPKPKKIIRNKKQERLEGLCQFTDVQVLLEEAVDEPASILLSEAGQSDDGVENNIITLKSENFPRLKEERLLGNSHTIFIRNPTDFTDSITTEDYEAVLSTDDSNCAEQLIPSQSLEINVSDDGTVDSVQFVIPRTEGNSTEKPKGEFVAIENEEFLQNFVTSLGIDQSNHTVIVVIETGIMQE